ncbi:MAG: hypothetical protein F6K58_13040 [Symploca sp. SIO2E9]|nr:hypothetical protein [Symploca sp. SIO2E9]
MVQSQESKKLEGWQPYNLDYYAQEIVLKHRDTKHVLNESHKMRMAVAYGLERFWGEHLRLKRESINKSQYWKDVWNKLAEILKLAEITLPNDEILSISSHQNRDAQKKQEEEQTKQIKGMAKKIWSMPFNEQKVALMVLTQFCDALVWWTQRYKRKDSKDN